MQIAGKWQQCDDGVVRPILVIDVITSTGVSVEAMFLVDSGADRTVFSEALAKKMGGATASAPSGVSLAGIGGTQSFVQVHATLKLPRTDGGVATVQANFAAFTDPSATDFCILGRDVKDHFDVILSKRRDELFLLAPPSQYEIHS